MFLYKINIATFTFSFQTRPERRADQAVREDLYGPGTNVCGQGSGSDRD